MTQQSLMTNQLKPLPPDYKPPNITPETPSNALNPLEKLAGIED